MHFQQQELEQERQQQQQQTKQARTTEARPTVAGVGTIQDRQYTCHKQHLCSVVRTRSWVFVLAFRWSPLLRSSSLAWRSNSALRCNQLRGRGPVFDVSVSLSCVGVLNRIVGEGRFLGSDIQGLFQLRGLRKTSGFGRRLIEGALCFGGVVSKVRRAKVGRARLRAFSGPISFCLARLIQNRVLSCEIYFLQGNHAGWVLCVCFW